MISISMNPAKERKHTEVNKSSGLGLYLVSETGSRSQELISTGRVPSTQQGTETQALAWLSNHHSWPS